MATIVPQKNTHAVYRKVNNSFWNDQIKKIRSNYGNEPIEANDVIKHIFRNPNDGNSIYLFVSDPSPHINMVDYGVKFLNQNTPAFIGYDKLATRMDFHFVYCDMKKVKRGFYQVNYYRIFPDGEKFKEFEVVDKFHALLEETIRKNPDNYLWSHRKWKYAHAIKRFNNKFQS
jgi:KDO2-lipid IV(A) lauroyltransferase